VPTKTAPSLALLSWTGEGNYDERLEGRDKDRARSLTCQLQSRTNQTELGEKRPSEALPPLLIALALASRGSVSELTSTVCRTGGKLLTEATAIAPHYQNLAMQTYNTLQIIFGTVGQ